MLQERAESVRQMFLLQQDRLDLSTVVHEMTLLRKLNYACVDVAFAGTSVDLWRCPETG